MTARVLVDALFPPYGTHRLSVAFLMLRVFVGVAFLFHGFAKLADITAFSAEFHIPHALAAVTAYTQVVSAALLIAGLFTPAAALALAVTMAVATATLIARGERFFDPGGHSWELASFYLITNLVLVLAGPGRWSLDRYISTRRYTSTQIQKALPVRVRRDEVPWNLR